MLSIAEIIIFANSWIFTDEKFPVLPESWTLVKGPQIDNNFVFYWFYSGYIFFSFFNFFVILLTIFKRPHKLY